MNNSSETEKIKIWYRLNFLKMKAGGDLNDESVGYIAPLAVRQAQAVINDQEKHYYDETEALIQNLEQTWSQILESESEADTEILQRIFINYAHNVKDVARTFQYDLMADFGESLYNFCTKMTIRTDAQKAIIEAHLKVIRMTFKTHIKESIGEQAEELKSLLKIAIEKHLQ